MKHQFFIVKHAIGSTGSVGGLLTTRVTPGATGASSAPQPSTGD